MIEPTVVWAGPDMLHSLIFSWLKSDTQSEPSPVFGGKFWCHGIGGVGMAMVGHDFIPRNTFSLGVIQGA